MKKSLLLLVPPLLVINHFIGEYSDNRIQKEFNRLNPIVQKVNQKAIGSDNYFSSQEQRDFARAMGYKERLSEGEVVDFGLHWDVFFNTDLPQFALTIGNPFNRYKISEERVRNYLKNKPNPPL
jgi:hypothetical protein